MNASSEPRASIAVLPFRNLSPEHDSGYFTRGFVEDLTTELTRFSTLRVLASPSASALGESDPPEDLLREWNIDFFLAGSIRVGSSRLRVSVQLIREPERDTIWADRLDAPLENVFELQDEIASRVAGRLASKVDEARLSRASGHSSENLETYECWLRGMECLEQGTLEGDEESRDFFEQALRLDPNYARAHAGLSLSHFNEWTCQAWHLWIESENGALKHALQAARIDDRDPVVQAVLARVDRISAPARSRRPPRCASPEAESQRRSSPHPGRHREALRG